MLKFKNFIGIFIISIFSVLLNSIICEDKLAFVFELIRHGARAPLRSADPWIFKVNVGDLTAEGMRQRLMFGKY